jgi:hypothetical protein
MVADVLRGSGNLTESVIASGKQPGRPTAAWLMQRCPPTMRSRAQFNDSIRVR